MSLQELEERYKSQYHQIFGVLAQFVGEMGLSGLNLESCVAKALEENAGLSPHHAICLARDVKKAFFDITKAVSNIAREKKDAKNQGTTEAQ